MNTQIQDLKKQALVRPAHTLDPFQVLIHDAEPFIYTDTLLKAAVEKDVLYIGKIESTFDGDVMEAVSIFAAGTWSIQKI